MREEFRSETLAFFSRSPLISKFKDLSENMETFHDKFSSPSSSSPSSSSSTTDEKIAATALLLLFQVLRSSTSSSSCLIFSYDDGGLVEEISSSSSSCISSSSEAQISRCHSDPLRMLAFAACLSGIKPQVMKKARSKNHHHHEAQHEQKQKKNAVDSVLGLGLFRSRQIGAKVDVDEELELETEPSTCASSSCVTDPITVGSEARLYPLRVTKAKCMVQQQQQQKKKKKTTAGNEILAAATTDDVKSKQRCHSRYISSGVKRRAEAIMELLSSPGVGWASEVRIRAALGNSPDTSKALRMLLRREEVKRKGAGGRLDPFVYMVASSNSMHSDVSSA